MRIATKLTESFWRQGVRPPSLWFSTPPPGPNKACWTVREPRLATQRIRPTGSDSLDIDFNDRDQRCCRYMPRVTLPRKLPRRLWVVEQWLRYLKSQPSGYRDIIIDEVRLSQLPEEGDIMDQLPVQDEEAWPLPTQTTLCLIQSKIYQRLLNGRQSLI
ncbi:hypothetical protein V8F20_001562 [Naviculisporaceae sp. PSN 640]